MLENAKFTNLLEIKDESIISKIHLNYRLNYLKDVAAARFIEENTLRNVCFTIHFNNSDIITHFINNKILMRKLFNEILVSSNIKYKSQGVGLLLELITMSRDIIQLRNTFLDLCYELNLLCIIEENISQSIIHNDFYKFAQSTDKNFTSNCNIKSHINSEKLTNEETKLLEIISNNIVEIFVNTMNTIPCKILNLYSI